MRYFNQNLIFLDLLLSITEYNSHHFLSFLFMITSLLGLLSPAISFKYSKIKIIEITFILICLY